MNIKKFTETYKSLYKALNSSDAIVEDFQRWLEIATNATNAVQYLLEQGNLTRGEKYSLETSLGHLTTVKLRLIDLTKCGGELSHPVNLDAKQPDDDHTVKWSEVQSAFKSRIKTGVITNLKHIDFNKFMDDAKKIFKIEIEKKLSDFNSVKINTALVGEYIVLKGDSEEIDTKQFNTQNIEVYKTTDLSAIFEKDIREVLDREMCEFEEKGSGWSLQKIIHLALNINKLNPMRAGCGINLPEVIKRKKACVNVNNTNEKCFKYAILACLNDVGNNSSRSSSYKRYENKLNFNGIDFPVKLKDISKFEKQNDISVNVYILKRYGEKYNVVPLHASFFTQEKSNHAD